MTVYRTGPGFYTDGSHLWRGEIADVIADAYDEATFRTTTECSCSPGVCASCRTKRAEYVADVVMEKMR